MYHGHRRQFLMGRTLELQPPHRKKQNPSTMKYSASALTVALAGVASLALVTPATAFSPSVSFVRSSAAVQTQFNHASGCMCPACTGALHRAGCSCPACTSIHGLACGCVSCGRRNTMLFSDVAGEDTAVAAEDVPAEVVAMDGVESEDEAHNADRPARKELKKKRPAKGAPLSEFEVGSTVTATVKSVTSYGAFCDFGATSDGLLHISRMSKEYVGDVSDVVSAGQELEVRIIEIDSVKNQIALSLLSEAEETEAKEQQQQQRERKSRPQRQQSSRGSDNAVLDALSAKGFDPEKFVPGKVVSVVPFGAFVRVDAKEVNSEVEGGFDGLVHISALTAGRASSVTDYANVDQDVQVRVKSIGNGKVSLTMMSVEEEAAQKERADSFGGGYDSGPVGAKDWKESLEKMQGDLPTFENKPLIVKMR